MDTPKKHRRDDEDAILMAVFRYGILAPILELTNPARGEVVRLVSEISQTDHHFPGKGPVRVGQRTLYDWLAAFREGGIEELRPRFRKDRGKPRVATQALVDRAVALRKENPERFTSTLLDILTLEKSFPDRKLPHRSTLDRHLRNLGASRRLLRTLGEKPTIKMAFERFGDLWVGDYHHGPLVLAPDGRPTTAKLGGFIDHTTRYPLASRYYLAEDIGSLRDCLLRAMLAWGRASKIYVDRGAVFRAEMLRYSLARIGTNLIHSRAYYSQGRGVIERWWQVANQFEAEVRSRDELLTLHELNLYWEAYRERRYCQQIHSDIGKTPNEAVVEVVPKPLDPQVVRELFLVRERRTVNKKTTCVSVLGREFLCEAFLRRHRVDVRFDPNDLSSVLIFEDGQRIQRAFPRPLNATPEPTPEPVQKPALSVDYLRLLREDYDRKLLAHARPLAYAQIPQDPHFGPEELRTTVTQLAGLALSASEREEIASFWASFGPLSETLTRIATEHAVRLHGRGRHVRLYLHAVRTLVLAELQNPQKRKESP
jgi:putative transposase